MRKGITGSFDRVAKLSFKINIVGVIAINAKYFWVVTRSSVQYALERVNFTEFSEALANKIRENLEIYFGYLDLERTTPEDRVLFALQVKCIIDILVQSGPRSLHVPSMFEGFVASLRDLQCLAEQSASA